MERIFSRVRKGFSIISQAEGIFSKIRLFFFLFFVILKRETFACNFLKEGLILRTFSGLRFSIRKNSQFDLNVCLNSYEYKTIDLIKKIKPLFMVDVGANIGRMSLEAAFSTPKTRIFAIEPDPSNFLRLKKHISLNNLSERVFPIQKALSDKKEVAKLYLDRINLGAHTLLRKSNNAFIKVETETLDNLLQRYKIPKVGLIKIDVEGWELHVLRGSKELLKKDHPKIIFESWTEDSLTEIKKFLKKLGYKYFKKIESNNYLAT